MKDEGTGHQVAGLGRVGLSRVADHLGVDDHAKAIHEPRTRHAGEHHEGQGRLDQVFG